MPQSPKSLTMLTLLACASSAQTEPINHTYWTYIPIPPLLQVVEWMEKGPIVLTNDSIHMPSP